MRRRNKVFLIVSILLGLTVVVSLSLGYYLLSSVPVLARASGSNPFEALRMAGKVMINEGIRTPVNAFNLTEASLKYNQTVEFPEEKHELITAEQIIEWSVAHNDQPWVDDVNRFLSEADYFLSDTIAHFVFIDCQSGNNPVMTLTYRSDNQSLSVEKGWINHGVRNSYTLIATESIALKLIKFNSDYDHLIKAIIENLNGSIKFVVGDVAVTY